MYMYLYFIEKQSYKKHTHSYVFFLNIFPLQFWLFHPLMFSEALRLEGLITITLISLWY